MSQLIDKLNHVAKAAPQPMGFRAAQVTPARPQMLLIAAITQAEKVAGLAEHILGADAVLVSMGKVDLESKAIEKIVRSLKDIPWGAWLKEIEEKEIDRLGEVGGDFVVFPASSALSLTLRANKMGRLLQVEPSLAEGVLRAINDLPVDAVCLAGETRGESPLTWDHLMLFQRAANILTKPLIVAVPANITRDELKPLWEMGVDGVIVEISKEQPADRMKELGQLAADLAKSVRRKRGKTEALAPSIKMGTVTEAGEEEEEDGDE